MLKSKPIRLGLCGASGKVGGSIIKLLPNFPKLKLVAQLNRDGDLEEFFADIDILIDFSVPEALKRCLDFSYNSKPIPIISGTTGHFLELNKYADRLPILWSPNMALGLNFLAALLKSPPSYLDFAIGISETHHASKRDAPSGTALKLAQFFPPEQLAPISYLRLGKNLGEHKIVLERDGEEISICHRVLNRDIFADSALKLALWLYGQPPGLYEIAAAIAELH